MLERGLSPTTVRHIHRLLREALSWAINKGLLSKNPTDNVDTPQKTYQQLEMWDSNITQDFASLIKKYNLPHLIFHGLRDAFATLALKAGINTKVVFGAFQSQYNYGPVSTCITKHAE